MKELIIKSNDANQRIDKYLKKVLANAPASFIYKMFRKKDVKVNGQRVQENYILNEGDVVALFLYEDKFNEFSAIGEVVKVKKQFDVLYEDNHVLVVNKPAGLLVHEDVNETTNTLTNQVLYYLSEKGELDLSRESSFMPGPVHRLDRNTSGIVIFGKTMKSLQILNEMIKQRHCIEKEYVTITNGRLDRAQELVGYVKKVDNEARVIFVKKEDPNALMMKTLVYPVLFNDEYSLVRVKLVTGRMHQIRIHLASINNPIIGDRKYGNFNANKLTKAKFGLNNQLLHAYKVKFVKTWGELDYLLDKEITAPIPQEFLAIKNKIFGNVKIRL
ncbi:MAG: RluA family pseudouridine synthase [Erysipelotrichaceae bacterium]|nr:RluA family pseudouridine synthase [Erysipelotrichaceae bacterium]MDD3808844.1 RluA family pseudouridine synthase [Erysipelotrichaceae bacterium]